MTPSRSAKLAEIERMIQTARMLLRCDMMADGRAETEARLAILEAIAEDLRRPAVTIEQIMDILEAQEVDIDGAAPYPWRILGIATTAEAIMALIEGKGNE